MITYYGSVLSPNQLETAEGYLVCRNVPIARTGEQEYLAGEFGLEGDPNNRITITRRPNDVFAEAAIASFEGKPVTDGHPPEDVRAENYSAYAKGHLQNVRRSGDTLMGDIYINDAGLVSDVRNNIKREISCGYRCTLVPNGNRPIYEAITLPLPLSGGQGTMLQYMMPPPRRRKEGSQL